MNSKGQNTIMFYLSAFVAILGAVGYNYFVKMVPATINPVVSVMGSYLAVLGMGVLLLLFFPAEGGLLAHIRQLSWIQLVLAVTVIMIELGFLLMYRYGWNLSTGNLVTGVFVNIILVGLGLALLGEKVSPINALGIVLSMVGVALISYR
jgi:drug/metabolite transporter (DMT)-like permease